VIDHPARARIAEVIVTRTGKGMTRGSGYLVSPGWVLTAGHVVADVTSIGVWFGVKPKLAPEAGVGVDIRRVLILAGADLALLPVEGHPSVEGQLSGPSVEPVLWGRLDREPGPAVPAAAAGCPRFKLRSAPGRPDVLLRELHYAIGSIPALSDAKTDRFAFTVDAPPGPDPEPGEHSPWEGMSGAAVWGSGRLIGVVGQHHQGEGLATLTVLPFDQLFAHPSERELADWRAALPQLPAAAADLGLAVPPTARTIELARARQAVQPLVPRLLVGREAESAMLAEFAGSGASWRWLQGDAFAGKTALLAWFALHPPDRVDVVACFLRRTTGNNTAAYALDMLTRQLALLAERRDYQPPPFPTQMADDLADLLDGASRACTERGRRLLVLIDGLDEYDPTPANLGLAAWLPGTGTLPDQAMLLAASRTGADVGLPPAHPLSGHVQRISASDAAAEIRAAAHAELERALMPPDKFSFPLIACLAVAQSGLAVSELRALLKRRGRDADVSEITALVGSFLGRSLVALPDPGGLDSSGSGSRMYVFAHDTLLAEARERVAGDLADYEDLFDAWAGEYAQRDWPADTPRYLLDPYTRVLISRANDPGAPDSRCRAATDQLYTTVMHRSRLLRLFERSGNPALPDQEIVAAQHAIIDTRGRTGLDPDEVNFRLAVLVLRRRPLTGDRAEIAAKIAAVFASIGRADAGADLAVSIDDPAGQASTLSSVATALAEAGHVQAALRSVSGVSDPAARALALASVAAVLAKAGQAAQAIDIAGQAVRATSLVDDPAERIKIFGGAAAALAEAGDAEAAVRAASGIDDPAERVSALASVAAFLAGAGRVEQAADIADRALRAAAGMDDPREQASALTSVADVMAQAGRVEQAADIADRALRAASGIDDPADRASALTSVAASLVGAGQGERAADIAVRALQAGAGTDEPLMQAVIMCSVAGVLAAAGDAMQAADIAVQAADVAVQAAEVAVQALQAAVRSGDEAMGGFAGGMMHAMVMHQAVRTLIETGRPDDVAGRALQATSAADDPEERANVLAMVAVALADGGRTQAALQVADSIDATGKHAEALAMVAVGLAEAGQVEEALRVADGIHDPVEQVEALSGISAALTASAPTGAAQVVGIAARVVSTAERAVEAATAIDDQQDRALALRAVARALARCGQAGPALRAAQSIDDRGHRVWGVRDVAIDLAQAGQVEQAFAVAAGIDQPKVRATAFSELAQALVEAGQEKLAADAADLALRAAASIDDDPQLRVGALNGAAAALAEAGHGEQAADVARLALRAAAGIDDPREQAWAVRDTAQAVALAGQAGFALRVAVGVVHLESRTEALAMVMRALAEAGKVAEALPAATTIDDPAQRAWALSSVAVALAADQQPGQAADVAADARQAASPIQDPQQRAETLSVATQALAAAGQSAQAAGTARQAVKAAAAIANPELRTRTLDWVAEALAKAGQVGPALQAANHISDAKDRGYALRSLAGELALRGQAGPALRAVAGIHDRDWRIWGERDIARALAWAGRTKRALQVAASIDEPEVRATALTEVAEALLAAGRGRSAMQAADLALRAAAGVDDPAKRTEALSKIAMLLASTGNATLAADAATQTLRAARAVDGFSRGYALSYAAQALAGSGQHRRGMDVANSIQGFRERETALGRVVQALGDSEQVNQARRVAAGILDPRVRSGALSRVAADLDQAGRTAEALDVAKAAFLAAADINDPSSRAPALAALLANPVIRDSQAAEPGRQTLELLLLTARAPEYLATFPVPLLQRLIASEELHLIITTAALPPRPARMARPNRRPRTGRAR
jgi:tetratricopeptide (TPR) repeat protein